PYDVAKAKQLLVEAGYPNGFKLTIDWTPSISPQEIPLAIQADFKAVGIDASINSIEPGAFADWAFGRKDEVRNDLISLTVGEPSGFGTDGFFGCDKPVGAKPALILHCNAEFDRLMKQAVSEDDPAKRRALMVQATKIQANDVPALFLMARPTFTV